MGNMFPAMRTAIYASLLIPAILTGWACGGEPSGGAPADAPADPPVDDPDARSVRTPTDYATSLLFLDSGNGARTGMILHLSNYAEPTRLQRRYHAWLLVRSGWRELLTGEWIGGPVRAPWRVLPGDSFDVVVTDEGEPDAFVIRTARSSYTLELGPRIDGWQDRRGTGHELGSARLTGRDGRHAGILVRHRFVNRSPDRPTRFHTYFNAALQLADGSFLILFDPGGDEALGEPFAWMYRDGLTRRWTSLQIEVLERTSVPELRRNLPRRIRIAISEPEIRGELRTTSRVFSAWPDLPGVRAYHAVFGLRGSLEIAGARQAVEGILERGEG